MTATVLSTTIEGGVRIVTLNRPERLNAITPTLLDDLIAALDAANADPDIRAIILTGAGRAFCSGDDLKEFADQVGPEAATRAMTFGAKPVIGAIHGWAVGGGLEWTINCDFAIAAENTRFFFPEISWGVFVTGGVTALLPRLVGLQRTRELIMLGEKFTATQAHEWGLIYRVVPDTTLLDEAITLARRIAALPPGPVQDLRRALVDRPTLEAAMRTETDATVRGFLDPESATRITRFG